jgi:hypothetical protein
MERCQLDEFYFPLFLNKLGYRPELQSVTLSNLSLGAKSSKALIHRSKSLKALAMVNVKLYQIPIADFLLDFGEHPTSLQRLALVEMNLNGRYIKELKKIIEINPKLDDLNLARNAFTKASLFSLIEILEKANKIRSINFEGNTMAGAKEQPPRGKPKEQKSSKADKKAAAPPGDWRYVCAYMKKSNLLQHIDLSNTFLC